MRVLGLDVETTGLDIKACELIELGAVVWDVEAQKPLCVLSDMVVPQESIPAEVTEITGIAESDVREFGKPVEFILNALYEISKSCTYIVAHNGNRFDKPIMERYWEKYPQYRLNQEWLDTSVDLPLPEGVGNGSKKLGYLAADHGFLNPFAHRALFDVLTMLKVFSQYSIKDVLAYKSSPSLRLVAEVSFANKDLAKNEGFRWEPGQKYWYMDIKECRLPQNKNYPFPVRQISFS